MVRVAFVCSFKSECDSDEPAYGGFADYVMGEREVNCYGVFF